jgi:uncharacterized glyoxalase superfamily protein PhnB
MKFASVRVVTAQFDTLVEFYSRLTEIAPTHLAPGFAEIRLPGATLAISGEEIINRVNGGAIVPRSNRSMMLELQVDDVAATLARLGDGFAEIVQPATTMPWGNVSLLLRDPDGAIVNIFSRPTA